MYAELGQLERSFTCLPPRLTGRDTRMRAHGGALLRGASLSAALLASARTSDDQDDV